MTDIERDHFMYDCTILPNSTEAFCKCSASVIEREMNHALFIYTSYCTDKDLNEIPVLGQALLDTMYHVKKECRMFLPPREDG